MSKKAYLLQGREGPPGPFRPPQAGSGLGADECNLRSVPGHVFC